MHQSFKQWSDNLNIHRVLQTNKNWSCDQYISYLSFVIFLILNGLFVIFIVEFVKYQEGKIHIKLLLGKIIPITEKKNSVLSVKRSLKSFLEENTNEKFFSGSNQWWIIKSQDNFEAKINEKRKKKLFSVCFFFSWFHR